MDTLQIFGDEFTNVTGIKATDNNGDILTYVRLTDGDNLGYGGYTSPTVGTAVVGMTTLGSVVGSAIVGSNYLGG